MEMTSREAAVPANAAAYFSFESPLHEVRSAVEAVMARMMIVVTLMLMERNSPVFPFSNYRNRPYQEAFLSALTYSSFGASLKYLNNAGHSQPSMSSCSE